MADLQLTDSNIIEEKKLSLSRQNNLNIQDLNRIVSDYWNLVENKNKPKKIEEGQPDNNQPFNLDTQDNEISNKLATYYDIDFNKKYMKINALNKDISTKNKLINLNQIEYLKKQNAIYFISSTIFLILTLAIILAILKMINASKNIIFMTILLIFLLYALNLYKVFRSPVRWDVYKIKTSNNIIPENNNNENCKDRNNEYLKDDYSCKLYGCDLLPPDPEDETDGEEEAEEEHDINIDSDNSSLLLDSSTNVWKYGDIPETNRCGKNNIPKPLYPGVHNKVTKYVCQLNNMTDKPNIFTSTIPCKYYLNYERYNAIT